MTEEELFIELQKTLFCQSSKDILVIFKNIHKKIKFPYELEKKYFFENFYFFLKKNNNKISAINRIFHSIPKEEKKNTYKFIVLLIELYHKNLSQEYNEKLINIISSILSNIDIENLPIDKIEKFKPFSSCIVNNNMLKKYFSHDKNCINENNIIFILSNKLITDNFEYNNIKFLFNAFIYKKKGKNKFFIEYYERLLKNNYSNLYNSKEWLISVILANKELEGKIYSYSWNNLISDYSMDKIYQSYKLNYPGEGFLNSFISTLEKFKNKKININKKENIFETLIKIFSLCKPDFFYKEEDSIVLHKILLYFENQEYFQKSIETLKNNKISIDYKLLFIESIEKNKGISIELLKEFKYIKDFDIFSKSDINKIWSKIIRNNNNLLLNKIISLEYFPQIEYKLFITFYGNSLSSQLNKFNDIKSLTAKEKILSFHNNLFLYIDKVYLEVNKKELIIYLYKNNHFMGELFSLIEKNILKICSSEQINLRKRI